MSGFAKEFADQIIDYLENNTHVATKLNEAKQQGIGQLSRIFDDMQFTDAAANQAYEDSIKSDDIPKHSNQVVRDAIIGLLNKDMTDLSDHFKKKIGDENYQTLVSNCPNGDTRILVNTLLQATLTIYGQLAAKGLDNKKTSMMLNPDTGINESDSCTLTQEYNSKVSSVMERYIPMLNPNFLNGQGFGQLSSYDDMIKRQQNCYDVLQDALITVNKFYQELFSQLGYPICSRTSDDESDYLPNTLYLTVKESKCYYYIKDSKGEVYQGSLDSINQYTISSQGDVTESKLERYKLIILKQLEERNVISPINETLASNIKHLQKIKSVLKNQLDIIDTSNQRHQDNPLSQLNLFAAQSDLEKVCENIGAVLNNDMKNVEQNKHIISWMERFLNILYNIVYLGKKGYKSEETKRAELPATIQSVVDICSIKQRLNDEKSSICDPSKLNENSPFGNPRKSS